MLDRINLDDENLDLSQILNVTSGLLGRGGMKTKIEAARTSLNQAMTWVASGLKDDTLLKIFKEDIESILLKNLPFHQENCDFLLALLQEQL